MFGLLAGFNCFIAKKYQGRDALIYENYIRTGQGVSLNAIYRESSLDKYARRELGAIRYTERLRQQIKLIRLMKKLFIKVNEDKTNPELEQMRIKIEQLAFKVQRAALKNNLNCDDIFNIDRPDDDYDIELEKLIRTTVSNTTTTKTIYKYDEKAGGDYYNNDQRLLEHLHKIN